eukprot:m.756457 g.756457  ORF g.756457 m.756457 type:complete len:547 (+) comp23184_c0_seq6:302-1942(+)
MRCLSTAVEGYHLRVDKRILAALVVLVMVPGALISTRHASKARQTDARPKLIAADFDEIFKQDGTLKTLENLEPVDNIASSRKDIITTNISQSEQIMRTSFYLQIENQLALLHNSTSDPLEFAVKSRAFKVEIDYLRSRIHQVQTKLLKRIHQKTKVPVKRETESKVAWKHQAVFPPVAFLKTHKTGSTTISALLFRMAARHNLTIAFPGRIVAKTIPPRTTKLPDLCISHLRNGNPGRIFSFKGATGVGAINSFYQRLLQDPTIKSAHGTVAPLIITLVRHPVSRTRSHFDYYYRSRKKRFGKSLDDFMNTSECHTLDNFQTDEIGILNDSMLDTFIQQSLDPSISLDREDSRGIHFIMLAERMTLSLVLLRRRLVRHGWECDMLDLLHLSQSMSLNWLGQQVYKSNVTQRARDILSERNARDLRLWQAAAARLERLVQLEKTKDGDGGTKFDAEVKFVNLANEMLKQQCSTQQPLAFVPDKALNDASKQKNITETIMQSYCLWNAMDDRQYAAIGRHSKGHPSESFARHPEIWPSVVWRQLTES